MQKAIRWRSDPATRLIGVLFPSLGICLLFAALFIGLAKLGFINASSTAPGTVVRLNAGGSHPEISFTTSSGEVIEYPQGGWIFGYQVGDIVTVLYDPQNPHEACIDNTSALWFAPFILSVISTVFIVTGLSRAIVCEERQS
jgi:hypothetical protein